MTIVADIYQDCMHGPHGCVFCPRGDDSPITREEMVEQVIGMTDMPADEVDECIKAAHMRPANPGSEMEWVICKAEHPDAEPYWWFSI